MPVALTDAASPRPAASWRLRTRTLEFGPLPRIMGIVNVTPDSFSDGGQFFDAAAAVDQALQLAADGADIIDVGGESTRPYAAPVSADDELQRVVPVVAGLQGRCSAIISIDTTKACVARAALDAGAEIVNDISALRGDPAMVEAVVASSAGVCAMHMQGTPQTMQDDPRYDDVVAEVYDWLRERRDALLSAGVDADRLALDPGIGFGKTHEHNLTLMANCERFHGLSCPLVVGPSRKGFLGKLLGDKTADRDAATAGAALAAAVQGVQVLRVHNVRLVRDALLAYTACRHGGPVAAAGR